MNVSINGCRFEIQDKLTAADIRSLYCPDADAVIINSVPVSDLSVRISGGDYIHLLKKGSQPEQKELEWLMLARQPEAITRRLKAACVGIAGAGGLGTVVAENLARAGVGKLVIADFDIVELSNLNRQRYSLGQLGLPKVQALAENIGRFNPFVAVVTRQERITFNTAGAIFQGCEIVAECLDSPADKASVVSGILKHMPHALVVAASGLAGIGDGGAIAARKISTRLYLVGDSVSDAADGTGLFASRVGIAASMQSHVIIRLLAGEEP